jgi:hypothetical protein
MKEFQSHVKVCHLRSSSSSMQMHAISHYCLLVQSLGHALGPQPVRRQHSKEYRDGTPISRSNR